MTNFTKSQEQEQEQEQEQQEQEQQLSNFKDRELQTRGQKLDSFIVDLTSDRPGTQGPGPAGPGPGPENDRAVRPGPGPYYNE